jgi:hypothetical protein
VVRLRSLTIPEQLPCAHSEINQSHEEEPMIHLFPSCHPFWVAFKSSLPALIHVTLEQCVVVIISTFEKNGCLPKPRYLTNCELFGLVNNDKNK